MNKQLEADTIYSGATSASIIIYVPYPLWLF